jgi:hypothetical protein
MARVLRSPGVHHGGEGEKTEAGQIATFRQIEARSGIAPPPNRQGGRSPRRPPVQPRGCKAVPARRTPPRRLLRHNCRHGAPAPVPPSGQAKRRSVSAEPVRPPTPGGNRILRPGSCSGRTRRSKASRAAAARPRRGGPCRHVARTPGIVTAALTEAQPACHPDDHHARCGLEQVEGSTGKTGGPVAADPR